MDEWSSRHGVELEAVHDLMMISDHSRHHTTADVFACFCFPKERVNRGGKSNHQTWGRPWTSASVDITEFPKWGAHKPNIWILRDETPIKRRNVRTHFIHSNVYRWGRREKLCAEASPCRVSTIWVATEIRFQPVVIIYVCRLESWKFKHSVVLRI